MDGWPLFQVRVGRTFHRASELPVIERAATGGDVGDGWV